MIKELRKACSKNEDEPLALRIFRLFSIYLTALFARIGVSPNFVSLLSIAGTIIGTVLLMLGSYQSMVSGAAVLVFSHQLDYSDGELARYTGKTTTYGAYLEVLYSNVFYGLVFIGLAVGTYRLLGDVNMLWFGMSALLFKFLYRFCDVTKNTLLKNLNESPRLSPIAADETSPLYKRVVWEIFWFLFFAPGIVLLVLLFAIINKLNLLLIFYGVTMPLLFLVQSFFHWLDLRGR